MTMRALICCRYALPIPLLSSCRPYIRLDGTCTSPEHECSSIMQDQRRGAKNYSHSIVQFMHPVRPARRRQRQQEPKLLQAITPSVNHAHRDQHSRETRQRQRQQGQRIKEGR
ncbi:hypothetical protein CI102_6576 [Trichoderma harzianum]|nr:hypothetical protein CI102_6576 [Trichoderma harzianum]